MYIYICVCNMYIYVGIHRYHYCYISNTLLSIACFTCIYARVEIVFFVSFPNNEKANILRKVS